MIYTGSFRDICYNKYNEIWIIARKLKNTSILNNNNVFHYVDLSPSNSLLYDYLKWRNEKQWNKNKFESCYVPRFLQEIKYNTKAKQLLNYLYSNSFNKDILLVCFCTNEDLCHRSIIKGLLQGVKANVESTDKSYYYDKYLNI